MNKRIIIVVPILALLICVACFGSGVIGSMNPNKQTGEQGSILGNSLFNPSETPAPSETPYPTYWEEEPVIWQFEPVVSVFQGGYYHDEIGAVSINPWEDLRVDSEDPVDGSYNNVCGQIEKIDGVIYAYVTERTDSYWGDDPIPTDIPLFGTASYRDDSCIYEVVWVGPAPIQVVYVTNDELSEMTEFTLKDDVLYETGDNGKLYTVGYNFSNAVLLGCTDTFNPSEEEMYYFMTHSDLSYGGESYQAIWVGQANCTQYFENGMSGKIRFSDADDDSGYIWIEAIEDWEYAKQVATSIAEQSLDSEEYKAFAALYESGIIDEYDNKYDVYFKHYGKGETETVYRAYSYLATMDAKDKGIVLNDLNEYVQDYEAIVRYYGEFCYEEPDCYVYSTMDWRMVTTTVTPYQYETPTPSP